MDLTGAELARRYAEQVVLPLVEQRWPGLPCAAARLGSGSDVLGLDDPISRDHDWGLRLTLLVPADLVAGVDAHLADRLPDDVGALPTRFATTWEPEVRHRVEVADAATFARSRLGVDASRELTLDDWLGLTGQAVLEVVGGPVFVDTLGELTRIRERLEWYPDDLWRHLVAVDWARLAQELPFVGRTAQRGDDLGSRVITARLVGVAMHLGFLLERRWPPYAKWRGACFADLPDAGDALAPLAGSLAADDWHDRESGLVEGLAHLGEVQRRRGLPTPAAVVEPFWDRPFRTVSERVVTELEASVTDPAVRALPRGVGSVEQWSDNVDVLTRVDARAPGGFR